MEKIPGSWRGVVNHFRSAPAEIQEYFEDIPSLIENYDWEVSLSFMFSRVEKAMNKMLYCGAVKRHKADPDKAFSAVNEHHITRKEFRRLFKNVFGKPVKKALTETLEDAEKVRNKVIHGKSATPYEHRLAIIRIIDYAVGMNEHVSELASFKPFTNDLRGYTGRRQALDKSTTVWLMKGLGFQKKAQEDA